MSGTSNGFVFEREMIARHEKQVEMILSLGDLFESSPKGMVHDTSHLPHTKDVLLQALEEQISVYSDPVVVELFGASAMILANYQDGVGLPSLSMPDAADLEAAKDDDGKFMEIVKTISNEKFTNYRRLVSEDNKAIYEMVIAAKAKNPAMQPTPKTLWQRLTGR
jgi:hypothetical protein